MARGIEGCDEKDPDAMRVTSIPRTIVVGVSLRLGTLVEDPSVIIKPRSSQSKASLTTNRLSSSLPCPIVRAHK